MNQKETAANDNEAQNDYPTLAAIDEGDHIHPDNVANRIHSADHYTPDDAPEDQIGVVHQRKNNGKLVAVLYDARTDLYAVATARTDRHVRGCSHTEYRVKSIGSNIRAEITVRAGEFDEPDGEEGFAKEWLKTEAPVETVYGNHDWYYADTAYAPNEYSVFDNSEGFYPSKFKMKFVAE